jgi:hypothetical protein
MANTYTAGSYTKNYSWNKSYAKLHSAIRKGFSAGLSPITREIWRKRSMIRDADRQLIPLNFFLFSIRGLNEDFVLVDRLVERAFEQYDFDFARLALFAFHLANSGRWHRSKWPDGRVAGWANDFIRLVAWQNGSWNKNAFSNGSLAAFIQESIQGESVTKRKVLTNYRYMLSSAGISEDASLEPNNRDVPWWIGATQLFWDRQVFGGELHRSSGERDFEDAFYRFDIYKLLGCSLEQGRAIFLAAYRDYPDQLDRRLQQLEKLRASIAA